MKKRITITYPPDFDGELHIEVETTEYYHQYSFKYCTSAGDDWQALVRAARDILAQDARK